MNVVAPPSPSGLTAVDRQWGGFASGRAYLLVGRAGAGRSSLAFQIVRAAVDDGVRCLVISPRAPEALVEVARGVGLDLAQAHGAGQLRLLRIPAAADLAKRGPDGLAQSYRDLVGLVERDRPGRVVIEDFTPLVQFDTFERFHDAFSALVRDLGDLGATLVVGLGDPANDASRRLIDLVGSLVEGTIQLSASGNVLLSTPGPVAPSAPAAAPEEAPPAASSDGASGEAPAPPSFPLDLPDDAPAAPPSEAQAPAPTEAAEVPPAGSTNDGASVETDAPHPPVQTLALASAPAATVDGPPPTDLIEPLVADPDLALPPPEDPFGDDEIDAILGQGFVADSSMGVHAPPAAPQAAAPSFSFLSGPASTNVQLPTFAPLAGGPKAARSPAEAFRDHLRASFEARDERTPFLVVAVRIEPSQPEAIHFPTVEGALRSTLGEEDHLLSDEMRRRAIVLLPGSGPESGQVLFAGLQAHLRADLGDRAEAVLSAVGAVTIPDGQPFTSPEDLMAYAFEG